MKNEHSNIRSRSNRNNPTLGPVSLTSGRSGQPGAFSITLNRCPLSISRVIGIRLGCSFHLWPHARVALE